MAPAELFIVLAGNPNAGKTTVFNQMTGARQHVGNYPGVTVEKKEGFLKHQDQTIRIIDLPGTYSLSAYSPDEIVARNVIIEDKPDLIVNIVDASNLERNLYLTTQLMELDVPMVLALNMADTAENTGITIDYNLLSQLIGLPVVRLVGSRGQGLAQLLDTIVQYSHPEMFSPKTIRYSAEIEQVLTQLGQIIEKRGTARYSPRWLATKLLENDKTILDYISSWPEHDLIFKQLEEAQQQIASAQELDAELLIAEDRYAFIRGACKEAVDYTTMTSISTTDQIDRLVLNRVLGLPIFLGIMWLLFQMTFTLGSAPMEWIESLFTRLGGWITSVLPAGMLQSLLVDGIIAGVGGVVIFLPNIILLFLGIAFLEATGYMSRAAFVMDKVMHRVGLHGKSFVPMIIGFGCTIPAIMATRTLENPKDRLTTMLIAPLMSCGARLPVYTLLIAAFFPPQVAGNVLFSLYLIGILLALLMAKIFKTWLLPGESEPFVMELPIYRWPSLKSLVLQMWERSWLYLKKAGTVILAISIVMWGLFTFPNGDNQGQPYATATEQLEHSYAGSLGKTLEPVIAPLGFDWRTGIALVAGFAAKEVVVSTMSTLYSLEDETALLAGESDQVTSFAQKAKEQSGYTPLVAYVLMLFILIYVPCMATIAVIKRETNGWKWPLFTIGYTAVLAWIVCFIVYQGGMLLSS